MGPASLAAESGGNDLRHTAEPAAWQGPALTAQLVPPAGRDTITPGTTAPSTSSSATSPAPAQIITPSTTPKRQDDSPLLDGRLPAEELIPPVVSEGSSDAGNGGHHAVEPYGGGHPTDWPWGCGGNPYRTGPGLCDNYRIGPRWHVTVDGMVMHRESTDLVALATQMTTNDLRGTVVDPAIVPPVGLDPALTNFSDAPGARIAFTSQVGNCTGYDIQAVYEGINDWNSSIVFPKEALAPIADDGHGLPQFPVTPVPNTEPPLPFPEGFQQRSLHYRSDMNSVELNWLPNHDSEWRPIFGARFIRFDDEIGDSLNQERQPPLPGPQTSTVGAVSFTDPIGPTFETDRLNLFHLENNLMGFQVGLLHDTFELNNRFAIEGFVNGGVYYNQVKYSNVMVVSTTQTFADNTRFSDTNGGQSDARTSTSTVVNNDARDLSEISYEAEASLTGVCRLNRCWSLRAGYQMMWMNHIHTADAAYLGTGDFSHDLLFYGWHAGLECRR
jgi:hypothetical protein